MKILKDALCALLLLLISGFLILPISASTTKLTTTVPSHASLTIELSGSGAVAVGQQKITHSQTISVPRLQPISIAIYPGRNMYLASVNINGVDRTTNVKNGILYLDEIQFNTILKITFLPISQDPNWNPKTGDNVFSILALSGIICSWTFIGFICKVKM